MISPRTYPSVLRMTAPLVVSFWMRAAFTLVDTIYAATIGDAAVAAIGLTVPFEFLMIALWVGLSTGLTSALSRAMGARQGQKLRQYLHACRRLVLLLSPLLALTGLGIGVGAPRLGLDPEVARSFQIYGATLIGGGALTSFWSILPDSVVKAHQDTRSTMWAGIASNLINVALNTIFVFVFHWGVFGIAFSTVVGRLGGLAYARAKARGHEKRREASGLDVEPGEDPSPYRTILALAIPSSATFALMAGETAIVNGLLASGQHATQAIAAYSIFHRVVLFALNPIFAAGVALLPYSARRYGEGDPAGIRRGLREAGVATALYCLLLVAPVLYMTAPWISRGLTESAVTTRYTTLILRLVPLTCLVGAPFLLCRPVFEGMHRGGPGLTMAALRYLLLTPPAAWLGIRIAEQMGQPGLYGLMAGLIGVSALTSLVFFLWLKASLPGSGSAEIEEPDPLY